MTSVSSLFVRQRSLCWLFNNVITISITIILHSGKNVFPARTQTCPLSPEQREETLKRIHLMCITPYKLRSLIQLKIWNLEQKLSSTLKGLYYSTKLVRLAYFNGCKQRIT